MKPTKRKFPIKMTALNSDDVENSNSICLTCLEKGYFRVVCRTYYHNEKPEVYAQMLSYCFSLQVAYSERGSGKDYYICDMCIVKLRAVTEFRKQIEIARNNYKKLFEEFSMFYNPDRKPDLDSEFECGVRAEEILERRELDSIDKNKSEEDIDIPESPLDNDTVKIKDESNPKSFQDSTKHYKESKENDSDFKWDDNVKESDDEILIVKRRKLKSQSGLYTCKECAYTTLKCSNLSHHLKSHLKEKPFLCEMCGHSYKTTTKLRLHQMTHTGSKPHACDVCQFTSRLRADLKCHMRIHTNTRPHTCEKCGASFKRSTHLKTHKLMHENISKFACQQCNFQTKSSHTFRRHCLNHAKNFTCDHCDKVFNDLVELRVHKVTEHDVLILNKSASKETSGMKKHFCDVCDRSFKFLVHLKSHMATHSDERPFACEKCESKFKRKGDLTAHQSTHSKSKPYTCERCSFATARIGDLREHFRTHTDLRPFVCNFCPLRFRKQTHLKQHFLTHSEDKPHVCELCGFRCKRTEDLKCHVLVHSGVRLECPMCDYTCLQRRQLRKHQLKHARDKINNTEKTQIEDKSTLTEEANDKCDS